MRLVTLLAVVALIGFGTAYGAVFETSDGVYQKAYTNDQRPHGANPDAGGESFADAVDMVALPFSDAGDLWDYTDDIDFNYGTSPDVVYKYTPDFDGCVEVNGCGSQYDQMMWIVAADMMTVVAWNDDGIACDLYQSQISWLPVYNGVLYYYVLDGYGGSAGPYDLQVTQIDCPPPVECPPEGIAEGEGCADPYVDAYNAGCNAAPPVFSTVDCYDGTIVICGTVFNYYTGTSARRDTDWFLMNLWDPAGHQIATTAYYESSGSLYYIAVQNGCGTAACIPYGIHLGSRELGAMSELLVQGPFDCAEGLGPQPTQWAIFMSKNYYDGTWYPCTDPESWPYVLTIDGYGCQPVPNETQTWGGVKNLFK